MEEQTPKAPVPAIEVRDLKKSFRIYNDKSSLLKDRLLFWKRNKYQTREVLRGLTFDVAPGEAVGLIGHNGCGKSTTLKMLTKIMYPNAGTIKMRGRVSALIELGAGFHPDMSGRENIYTNAAIFGLSRKEVNERMDTIIGFSELGEYIDNPVRTYSSGMYMRLAFSVAINVDADILLVDEILAVGDAAFQAKCLNKLREIKANGTTVIIVSHDLNAVEHLCDRSIWIRDGLVCMDGRPADVHRAYLDYMNAPLPEPEVVNAVEGDVVIRRVTALNAEGRTSAEFRRGGPLTLRVEYTARKTLNEPNYTVGFFGGDRQVRYATDTRIDRVPTGICEGEHSFLLHVDSLSLMPGHYAIDVEIVGDKNRMEARAENMAPFTVTADRPDVGIVYLPHRWELDPQLQSPMGD